MYTKINNEIWYFEVSYPGQNPYCRIEALHSQTAEEEELKILDGIRLRVKYFVFLLIEERANRAVIDLIEVEVVGGQREDEDITKERWAEPFMLLIMERVKKQIKDLWRIDTNNTELTIESTVKWARAIAESGVGMDDVDFERLVFLYEKGEVDRTSEEEAEYKCLIERAKVCFSVFYGGLEVVGYDEDGISVVNWLLILKTFDEDWAWIYWYLTERCLMRLPFKEEEGMNEFRAFEREAFCFFQSPIRHIDNVRAKAEYYFENLKLKYEVFLRAEKCIKAEQEGSFGAGYLESLDKKEQVLILKRLGAFCAALRTRSQEAEEVTRRLEMNEKLIKQVLLAIGIAKGLFLNREALLELVDRVVLIYENREEIKEALTKMRQMD